MKTVILYNPNSTGDSAENAKALARELKGEGLEATVRKTEYAGHGEKIAAGYAKRNAEIILISSSGDGGYHEVINGALAHSTDKMIVGVLPSGNANDHHSALKTGSLVQAIRNKKFRRIDTIKVTSTVDGKPWVRYAHSYVGMGVAAIAAKQLTVERPNVVTEKFIVARSLMSFRYVKLNEDGHTHRYSSLLFANIDRMSKVIKLSEGASITDGKFELSRIRFRSKLRLIAYLVTAATIGLKNTRSTKRFACKTVTRTPIQLDGEVYMLDANSDLVVESVKQNLHCVL